eukprot:7053937-Pyramimonas_sp.AAC.1
MVVDQVSLSVVVLTSNGCLATQCAIGIGNCSCLCGSFNACPANHLFSGIISCLCRLLMAQNRQVRKPCLTPPKQNVAWRHLIVEGERIGGKQSFMQPPCEYK